jgi:hypothetical protein
MEATKVIRELPINFTLAHGAHGRFDQGACLMEAVAYVAGEPHSDHPTCASPILSAIGRGLNDRFRDEERQLLAPLIPRLVGTLAPWEIERKRAYAMVDAAIREITPMGLDATWTDLAGRMRAIAPIVDRASAELALAACREIRAEARKRSVDAAYAAAAAAEASAYAASAASAASASAEAAEASTYASAYAASAASAASASSSAEAAEAVSPEERARARTAARRPIIEATIRAFERAIEIGV